MVRLSQQPVQQGCISPGWPAAGSDLDAVLLSALGCQLEDPQHVLLAVRVKLLPGPLLAPLDEVHVLDAVRGGPARLQVKARRQRCPGAECWPAGTGAGRTGWLPWPRGTRCKLRRSWTANTQRCAALPGR